MANSHHNTPVTVSRRTLLSAAAVAPALAAGEALSADAALRRAWMEAAYDAATLRRDAARLRAELTERIGPRSLPLGTVRLPDGRTFPIHVESISAFHRLVRLIPETAQGAVKEAFPDVHAAVLDAQHRWDAEAARSGLPALEQRANGAHDRAKALFTRLPAHTV